MKKGDVGMAKSAPDATSLHHCLQNLRQYYTILNWIQALDTKGPLGKGIS